MILSAALLAACATSVPPVPETGAYTMRYVELEGDYFLKVEKVGVNQAVVVYNADNPGRREWRRGEWEGFADRLFPADEINFAALRELRGSNLVPRGLVSPTPQVIPPCETTRNPEYAKVQQRLIRRAKRGQPLGEIAMKTTCELHAGLSPNQYDGVHARPNPYRFPVRYETIVDLDRNNRPEERAVRLYNVRKAEVLEFVQRETSLPGKVRNQTEQALDRL
jgi:hypothetical protein